MPVRGRAPLIAALAGVAALAALVLTTGGEQPPSARPGPPPLHATPGTLERVFAKARGGDTILLASGRYGTFRGGMKRGMVTLAAEPGAEATIAAAFSPARNITLDGLRITALEIGGSRSEHITVRNSRFDGAQAIIRTADLSHADILLERNTHAGYDKCDEGCYEGRVQLVGHSGRPSGVTIRDSVFGPGGNSDGIQNGGYGVQILRNRFVGIHQTDGADGVHADAIQLYGSKETVIRGNRMTDVATGIMAPDGTDHELVEENFIETNGYPFAITIGADDGSVIRRNRLPGGACEYELSCGTLRISPGKDGGPGAGTVVEHNLLGALAVEPGAALAVEAGNVIESDASLRFP
jgi:Right handed beta helix region